MKKRTAGGAAVVIFALGFFLSQFWNFGGLGSGEGESASNEQSTETNESESADETDLSGVNAGGASSTTLVSSSTLNAGEQKYITIVIHKNQFRLTSEDDPQSGVDVPLQQVVKQVSQAKGGEQGIKLRILFEKNAQEGSLADLYAALQEAGVKREEIQEISDYID